MPDKEFNTMLQELIRAEEKCLGVGSKEFMQRHKEIMELADISSQKGR